MLQEIQATSEFLKNKTALRPEVGIVLGTGLSGLTKEMEIRDTIPYRDIPHFPVSTVKGHPGNLLFGMLGGKQVVAMQGRFHYYEGYTMQQVTYPIRVMKQLGVKYLFLSNASGGMNPDFEIGDMMVIKDHINHFPENPLTGPNIDELGPRFPDMSDAYDSALIEKAFAIAVKHNIKLHKGVYVGLPGPNFETPAEYHYLRIIGGDNVGMSTVPEVLVARHMGISCFGISIITDLGVPGKIVKITHEEVLEMAAKAEPKMTMIVKEIIKDL